MATTLQSLSGADLSTFSEEVRQLSNEVRGRGPGSLAPNSVFMEPEAWAAFVAEQVDHPVSRERGVEEEDYLAAAYAALTWQAETLGPNSGPAISPEFDVVFFDTLDASIAARKRRKWLTWGGIAAAVAAAGAGAWAFLRGRRGRAA
mgnify:CR=1 FL=1